jgi:hypothetical protein
VFYLKAAFGTGVETAILESPIYNIKSPACLSFYYLISSPTVILNVLNKEAPGFVLLANMTYGGQVNLTSWNKAFIMLQDGVMQLRLSAEKFGITTSPQFVIVDRINLAIGESCRSNGE